MYCIQEQNYNLCDKGSTTHIWSYACYKRNICYFCALDLNLQLPQGTLTVGILLPGDNAMITCVYDMY